MILADSPMEARPGVEPGYTDLQSSVHWMNCTGSRLKPAPILASGFAWRAQKLSSGHSRSIFPPPPYDARMPRPTVVRIQHGTFQREESFLSKVDAEEWRQMMLDTLAMPQAAALDMHAFARGLADMVRVHGGPHTRIHWLSGDAGPERWAKGLVVPPPRELTDQIIETLRGKRRG